MLVIASLDLPFTAWETLLALRYCKALQALTGSSRTPNCLNDVQDLESAGLQEGILTVSTETKGSLPARDDILNRLDHLPQVREPTQNKGSEDQLWQELTSYTQGSCTCLWVQRDPLVLLLR